MATYRNRLSKRQKRRSLKRKNVKSRKVMRGGSAFTGLSNCQTYVRNARSNTEDPEAKYAIQKFYLGKFKEQVKGTDANPCGSAAFYENFKPV